MVKLVAMTEAAIPSAGQSGGSTAGWCVRTRGYSGLVVNWSDTNFRIGSHAGTGRVSQERVEHAPSLFLLRQIVRFVLQIRHRAHDRLEARALDHRSRQQCPAQRSTTTSPFTYVHSPHPLSKHEDLRCCPRSPRRRRCLRAARRPACGHCSPCARCKSGAVAGARSRSCNQNPGYHMQPPPPPPPPHPQGSTKVEMAVGLFCE